MNTNLSRRFRKALSAIAILTLAMLTGGMSYEALGRVLVDGSEANGRAAIRGAFLVAKQLLGA